MAGPPISKEDQCRRRRDSEPAKKGLRQSHGNTVPKNTGDEVMARAGWICEAQTPDCEGPPEHAHHRRLKAQGVDHTPSNLLAVCGTPLTGCHGAIHRHVGWSLRHGFLLAAGDDPELLIVGCGFDCETDHRQAVPAAYEGMNR